VNGGLKAFGANVVIPGKVQGESTFLGANIILSGTFQDGVKAAAANITLSGTFEDNVEVGAAKITITPAAVIKGDLSYAAAILDRQEGSQITGKLIPRRAEKKDIKKWARLGRKIVFWLAFTWWLISIPGLIIIGMLMNLFFPSQTNTIVATISESPWKNIGIGLVFLVVVPVGIMISFVTLVGIPAGIIAGLLYGIAIYMSRIYIAVWVGRKILGYIKKSLAEAFFWPLVVGTIIIALLFLIPFLGWLFRLFFLLISLGAMWVATSERVKQGKQQLPQVPRSAGSKG
jgi:cytoskeletal protein CcmA (bactofilin family)